MEDLRFWLISLAGHDKHGGDARLLQIEPFPRDLPQLCVHHLFPKVSHELHQHLQVTKNLLAYCVCINGIFSCFPKYGGSLWLNKTNTEVQLLLSILALQPLTTWANYCGGKAARWDSRLCKLQLRNQGFQVFQLILVLTLPGMRCSECLQ